MNGGRVLSVTRDTRRETLINEREKEGIRESRVKLCTVQNTQVMVMFLLWLKRSLTSEGTMQWWCERVCRTSNTYNLAYGAL